MNKNIKVNPNEKLKKYDIKNDATNVIITSKIATSNKRNECTPSFSFLRILLYLHKFIYIYYSKQINIFFNHIY